jgi:hypothetical protein
LDAVCPKEAATRVLALELERLDAYQRALHPLAIGGDKQAIDTCLRIQQQRARYLGLNAPEANPALVQINAGKEGGAESQGINVVFVTHRDDSPLEPVPISEGGSQMYSAEIKQFARPGPKLVGYSDVPRFDKG